MSQPQWTGAALPHRRRSRSGSRSILSFSSAVTAVAPTPPVSSAGFQVDGVDGGGVGLPSAAQVISADHDPSSRSDVVGGSSLCFPYPTFNGHVRVRSVGCESYSLVEALQLKHPLQSSVDREGCRVLSVEGGVDRVGCVNCSALRDSSECSSHTGLHYTVASTILDQNPEQVAALVIFLIRSLLEPSSSCWMFYDIICWCQTGKRSSVVIAELFAWIAERCRAKVYLAKCFKLFFCCCMFISVIGSWWSVLL